MPRILFCSPTPIDLRLGASKVYIEAAEGFRRSGWEVRVVGPDEVAGGPSGDLFRQPQRLREYLQKHAQYFDIIEYEHNRLPFPRSDFPPGPLFVARSVLLTHCVASTWIPPRPGLWPGIGRLLKGWRERRWWRRVVQQADSTLTAADLINVSNEIDRKTLVDHGHPADKIRVFPYGLFPERLAASRSDENALPDPPVIGFVGTFDPRKGMCEFPTLIDRIARRYDNVTFRMCGTAGMVPDAEGVKKYIPRRFWPRIEIYPHYDPNTLPSLLSGVSVGVFPSRVEGFGFGVLEMLASAIPVIAYNAPGPPEMLPPDYLVPVGAARELADRVCDLLADPDRLRAARLWAMARAADFCWEEISARTGSVYTSHLTKTRAVVL